MNNITGQTNDLLTRVNTQLERVEHMINALLSEVEMADLSTSERLNFALKFMAQHEKVLVLRMRSQAEQSDQQSQQLAGMLQRALLGNDSADTGEQTLQSEGKMVESTLQKQGEQTYGDFKGVGREDDEELQGGFTGRETEEEAKQRTKWEGWQEEHNPEEEDEQQ